MLERVTRQFDFIRVTCAAASEGKCSFLSLNIPTIKTNFILEKLVDTSQKRERWNNHEMIGMNEVVFVKDDFS